MVIYDGIRKEGIRRLSLKEGLRAKGFPMVLVDKVSDISVEELGMLQDIGRTTPLGIAIVGLCSLGKGGKEEELEVVMYGKFSRYLDQAQIAAGWSRKTGGESETCRFPAGTRIFLATVMSRDGITSSKICCLCLEQGPKDEIAQGLAIQVGESIVGPGRWTMRGENGGGGEDPEEATDVVVLWNKTVEDQSGHSADDGQGQVDLALDRNWPP